MQHMTNYSPTLTIQVFVQTKLNLMDFNHRETKPTKQQTRTDYIAHARMEKTKLGQTCSTTCNSVLFWGS